MAVAGVVHGEAQLQLQVETVCTKWCTIARQSPLPGTEEKLQRQLQGYLKSLCSASSCSRNRVNHTTKRQSAVQWKPTGCTDSAVTAPVTRRVGWLNFQLQAQLQVETFRTKSFHGSRRCSASQLQSARRIENFKFKLNFKRLIP